MGRSNIEGENGRPIVKQLPAVSCTKQNNLIQAKGGNALQLGR